MVALARAADDAVAGKGGIDARARGDCAARWVGVPPRRAERDVHCSQRVVAARAAVAAPPTPRGGALGDVALCEAHGTGPRSAIRSRVSERTRARHAHTHSTRARRYTHTLGTLAPTTRPLSSWVVLGTTLNCPRCVETFLVLTIMMSESASRSGREQPRPPNLVTLEAQHSDPRTKTANVHTGMHLPHTPRHSVEIERAQVTYITLPPPLRSNARRARFAPRSRLRPARPTAPPSQSAARRRTSAHRVGAGLTGVPAALGAPARAQRRSRANCAT